MLLATHKSQLKHRHCVVIRYKNHQICHQCAKRQIRDISLQSSIFFRSTKSLNFEKKNKIKNIPLQFQ